MEFNGLCICLQAINDADSLIICELMDDRHEFMTFCQTNDYEFSSVRHAKFSTMCLLDYLRNRKSEIDEWIESLIHSISCGAVQCEYKLCTKIKSLLEHTRKCSKKNEDDCNICKKFTAIICYHAKRCNTVKCPVPFCLLTKLKRSQQTLTLKLRHKLVQQRRISLTTQRFPESAFNY